MSVWRWLPVKSDGEITEAVAIDERDQDAPKFVTVGRNQAGALFIHMDLPPDQAPQATKLIDKALLYIAAVTP